MSYYTMNDSYRSASITKYSNVPTSYNLNHNSANSGLRNMIKSKYQSDVNPSDRRVTDNTTSQRFKNVNQNKNQRQELNIAQGSLGSKFVRISRAIDEIQSDLRCPFNQSFQDGKCIDNSNNVCPAEQYFDNNQNKCVDGTQPDNLLSLQQQISDLQQELASIKNILVSSNNGDVSDVNNSSSQSIESCDWSCNDYNLNCRSKLYDEQSNMCEWFYDTRPTDDINYNGGDIINTGYRYG